MTAPNDIRAALTAMLRATDSGEHALPEAERLAAVRPKALALWLTACDLDACGHDVDALSIMLLATERDRDDHLFLVGARIAARAALALPATPQPPCDRFITAREFHAHETRAPLANLTPTGRAHHQAFLEHELAVAEAAARQSHRRAGDVAREMPFVRVVAS